MVVFLQAQEDLQAISIVIYPEAGGCTCTACLEFIAHGETWVHPMEAAVHRLGPGDLLAAHVLTSLVAGEQYTKGALKDSRPTRWSLCT